jgi:hypothetical protein
VLIGLIRRLNAKKLKEVLNELVQVKVSLGRVTLESEKKVKIVRQFYERVRPHIEKMNMLHAFKANKDDCKRLFSNQVIMFECICIKKDFLTIENEN